MAEKLYLQVLGRPQIRRGERSITDLAPPKGQALLYYLAVTGRPHPREVLAGLLWGELPDHRARGNLRKALFDMRQQLEQYLDITRQAVAFNQAQPYWLDVDVLQQALEIDAQDAANLVALRQAADLYQGDFLADFYIQDALAFEEWVLVQREKWRATAIELLHRLADRYTVQQAYDDAIECAARLLNLDPWREIAHRQMMSLLARSGQRSAALAQYETCRRILATELGVEPMPETTALYERMKAASQLPPHNLPPLPAEFVGRVTELTQIRTHFDNPHCRLLTLVGPGGIGKTRLALEAAARYVQPETAFEGHAFAGGVYIVSLASVRGDGVEGETKALIRAIAKAINVSFYGSATPKTQLLNHLRQRRQNILLVLDNFEHLVDGAGLLIDILQEAPHIKMLVTSRGRLDLGQEWALELGGLMFPPVGSSPKMYPGDEALPTVPVAEDYSAITLFLQHAQRVQVGFTLSADDESRVVRICQLVAGMPLGLELAASWLRLFSCAEIVTEIEQNLDFLTTSRRDMPERHRSLRAVFEQSWQLLLPREQAVFRKLSLFKGGFQPQAAVEVAGASLPVLAALVDKSLLRRGSSERYEIHELLRQYAAEKLQEDLAAYHQVCDKHCHYYANLLYQLEAQLMGAEQQAALTTINAERDEVQSAWTWAVENTRLEALNKALHSLHLFDEARSFLQEGREAFEQAVAHLSLDPSDPAQSRLLGRLLTRQGVFCKHLGDYQKAAELLEQGLILLRRLGDQSEVAFALRNLGHTAERLGQFEVAQRWEQESLQLYQALGDQAGIAKALYHLGCSAEGLEAYEEAKRFTGQSLTIYKRIGNLREIALCSNNLGVVTEMLGDFDEATQIYRQSLQLFTALDDRWGVAMVLGNLGDVAFTQGHYQEAKGYYHKALKLTTEVWATPRILLNLFQVASVLAKEGQVERAIELLVYPLHHPATEGAFRERAQQLFTELSVKLPSDVVTAAQERVQAKTLELVVAEMWLE